MQGCITSLQAHLNKHLHPEVLAVQELCLLWSAVNDRDMPATPQAHEITRISAHPVCSSMASQQPQCAVQGRIKHDRMPAGSMDPRPDFLAAHQLYPSRAEPLIWLCWHHHKLMDNCTPGPGQHTCWLKHRAAAYLYAGKAAALPMPEVRPTCVQPCTSKPGFGFGREGVGIWRTEQDVCQTWLWQCHMYAMILHRSIPCTHCDSFCPEQETCGSGVAWSHVLVSEGLHCHPTQKDFTHLPHISRRSACLVSDMRMSLQLVVVRQRWDAGAGIQQERCPRRMDSSSMDPCTISSRWTRWCCTPTTQQSTSQAPNSWAALQPCMCK